MRATHKLAFLTATMLIAVAFAVPPLVLSGKPAPRPAAAEPEPDTTWRDGAVLALRVEHMFSGSCGSAVPIACTPTVGGFDVILLTCRHVASHMDAGDCAVFDHQGLPLGRAEVLKSSMEHDAALMRMLSPVPVPVIEVRTSPLQVTEDVWVAGYPRGGRLVITHGLVGHTGGASAPVFPGNSGGPVVDCRGRLVGIVAEVGVDRRNGAFIYHDMHFETLHDLGPWIAPYL